MNTYSDQRQSYNNNDNTKSVTGSRSGSFGHLPAFLIYDYTVESDEMTYISHPLIRSDTVESRAYQVKIAEGCLKDNTLVILSTGLGKTVIALMVAADVLSKGKKVLMLAPTKPLVEQHFETFSGWLQDVRIGTMNGNMPPEKRASVIADNDMIICTPQVVENDVENERYSLTDFGLIVFDEAHRAVGNYAYVNIAVHYHRGLTLGMTASPGYDMEKIKEVVFNLDIGRIEVRTDEDEDVSPYVHDIYMIRKEVTMPQDLLDVINLLKKMMNPYVQELIDLGLMDRNWPASTTHLLTVGSSLQKRLARGEKTSIIFRGLVSQSASMKLLHAIGLAETQGMSSVRNYMAKVEEEANQSKGSKASKEIVAMPEYKQLWEIFNRTNVEHPKISRVMSLVSSKINSGADTRVIVFSQYRETCEMLVEKLSKIENVRVAKLIGQSKGGLKQKEQVSMLEDFRSGKYNVIVSTSVGEEGLDVTSTDMVIFYEPVPSEIRTIQRRGRTGRKNMGEVYVLVAKGTRDEVFENSSKRKEEQMISNLKKLDFSLRNNFGYRHNVQTKLGEF